MAEVQLPAWAAGLIGTGLAAAGWFVRTLFERRWARADRVLVRIEATLDERLKLLRDLNGDLYNKWLWLADHPEAEDYAKAEPVANEIGTWLYKHSAYFDDRVRTNMVQLANLTFGLAMPAAREFVLHDYRDGFATAVWKMFREHQTDVEAKLGIHRV